MKHIYAIYEFRDILYVGKYEGIAESIEQLTGECKFRDVSLDGSLKHKVGGCVITFNFTTRYNMQYAHEFIEFEQLGNPWDYVKREYPELFI